MGNVRGGKLVWALDRGAFIAGIAKYIGQVDQRVDLIDLAALGRGVIDGGGGVGPINSVSAGPQLVGGQWGIASMRSWNSTAVKGNTHQGFSLTRFTKTMPGARETNEKMNQAG